MYIFTRLGKFNFKSIFNFVREQFFDERTIYTALAYFSDVMIPFAKYEFCSSHNLGQQLSALLEDKSETLSVMRAIDKELIEELIEYCHYEPIYQFLKTCVLFSI